MECRLIVYEGDGVWIFVIGILYSDVGIGLVGVVVYLCFGDCGECYGVVFLL